MSNTLDAKITRKKLFSESDLNEKTKILATKKEMKTLATKAELKAEQDKIVKIETYGLGLFIVQSYFNNDGARLYLIFQPIYKNFTTFSGLPYTISEWEFKGLSNEKRTLPYTANKNLSPKLVWNKSRLILRFKEKCLKQEDQAPFTPDNVVHLFIVYELDGWLRDLSTDFTLTDCLFETVKLTKNADPDKYKYSSYGKGFDSRSEFSLPDGSIGKNAIIFGADMSSSVYIDNANKIVLILGEEPTQGLDDTPLKADVQYSINFSRSNRKLCSSLHYDGSNSFLFVNATKICQFKANDSEIKKYPFCLGNI